VTRYCLTGPSAWSQPMVRVLVVASNTRMFRGPARGTVAQTHGVRNRPPDLQNQNRSGVLMFCFFQVGRSELAAHANGTMMSWFIKAT